VAYNYYPQSKRRDTLAGYGTRYQLPAKRVGDLSAEHSVVTDLIDRWNTIAHAGNGNSVGINALFGDTHVTYSSNYEAFDPGLWGDPEGVIKNIPNRVAWQFLTIISLLRP
jgi:hypothetical protein